MQQRTVAVSPKGPSLDRSIFRPYMEGRTLLLALVSGGLIGFGGVAIDHFVHGIKKVMASDVYTFLIAVVFCYVLLQLEARRRAVLDRRMQIAAEVNHHIRNALTGVVFTAAASNDPALQAVLEDATARIDWVLNTVLPDGASDLQWPVQAPEWSPSPWNGSRTESPAETPSLHR